MTLFRNVHTGDKMFASSFVFVSQFRVSHYSLPQFQETARKIRSVTFICAVILPLSTLDIFCV